MLYTVALTLIERVGAVRGTALIETFGTAEAIFRVPFEELVGRGVAPNLAQNVVEGRGVALSRADEIVAHCGRVGIAILTKNHPEYPNLLRECADAPLVLYVRGYVNFNQGEWVSVVGTRKATAQGVEDSARFVADVAQAFPKAVIISGLAFGIDKAAHQAAISNNLKTVAVMAGWVDDIVPRTNIPLARSILEKGGAIVSDMPWGTVISRGNFLSRNRIIAGLSHCTMIVESAAKGGSLVTADIALSYDREVFAMPGRSEDSSRQGTNMLIKSSKAILYQDISDIAQSMGWQRANFSPANPASLNPYLRETFAALPDTEPFTLDHTSETLSITTAEASSRLMALESQGFIKSVKGRLYQKAKF